MNCLIGLDWQSNFFHRIDVDNFGTDFGHVFELLALMEIVCFGKIIGGLLGRLVI